MIKDFLAQDERKDMLRLLTAGSVDDGKSTLIGRLLFDSKRLYEDQLQALYRDSRQGCSGEADYALLCDGLKAEREQGITIDVAYRYFATSRRKFIIADTPGHEQYTRNMVTGGSTADLAIILVDVRQGVTLQTRRHSHLIDMLGIKHIILAINKMDSIGYRKEPFNNIASAYRCWASAQGFAFSTLNIIPISALCGDNVINRSDNMAWYSGPTLLELLESTPLSSSSGQSPFRMPVQYIIRPNQDFRGFAGRVASGTLSVGDSVTVLPSGKSSRVAQIFTGSTLCHHAFAPQSVTIVLEDQIDISRGDMIVRSDQQQPAVGQKLSALMVWMDEVPLEAERLYYLKQGTTTVRATVKSIDYLLDINSGGKSHCNTLSLNQIAGVELLCSAPLVCDSYSDNRHTGAFIIIDPMSNYTSAAGIILGVQAADTAIDNQSVINISLSQNGFSAEDIELLNHFCRVVERRCGITINCTE
ncbi:MAG: sulfate adenylyltransferase subunit CysN [Alistipes sp.]|nr:sulfate adenylyltransferase subunit CysN [Alistipes sp.]